MPVDIMDTIKSCKEIIESGRYSDLELAIYMLRDTAEVETAGLDDLAWIMLRETISKNDVKWFIKELEEYLKKNK